MAQFETGNDPADHTNAEVVDFLTGNDATPDEYERVMQAERDGRGRVGILNLTGAPEGADVPAAEASEPAGPNEDATGQESPADQAKTVDDPDASGDAAVTAEPYPDEAPPQLGPEQPQSAAEEAAHAASLAAADAAQASDVNVAQSIQAQPAAKQATQTPEQALALAVERSNLLNRPRSNDNQ